MLAIVVPSEREFCVDYACRCRVMYVGGGPSICTRMLFISLFHARDGPKELLVAPLTQLVLIDHETPTHHILTCSHPVFLILAERLSHGTHVSTALGCQHRLARVGLYTCADLPSSSYKSSNR